MKQKYWGRRVSDSLSVYTNMDAVFLYNSASSDLWFVHNINRAYDRNREAADYLKKKFSETEGGEHLLGTGISIFFLQEPIVICILLQKFLGDSRVLV